MQRNRFDTQKEKKNWRNTGYVLEELGFNLGLVTLIAWVGFMDALLHLSLAIILIVYFLCVLVVLIGHMIHPKSLRETIYGASWRMIGFDLESFGVNVAKFWTLVFAGYFINATIHPSIVTIGVALGVAIVLVLMGHDIHPK